MKKKKLSTVQYLIVTLEELYSGYSWEEFSDGFKKIWNELINKSEPVNELEYQ